ncbi:MAG: pyridoxamine 5'-phosphate oxidase family protein [Chitinophagaceae bacterium]|nr:pyridoxamine 5'-phosphate oxidase family protein [Chitinophagaceae bacterium]
MGEHKDLLNKEAVSKLQELAEEIDMCMFTTALQQLPLTSRPMSTAKVDDEGNIWFLSCRSSHKNRQIEKDNRVQLFYAGKSSSEYLSVYGEASILIDREKAKELWSTIAKAWFTEGVDDPELSIIKVKPLDAYYWDTKHNKLVALLKIGAAIVTGKSMDDGVEGEINVNGLQHA